MNISTVLWNIISDENDKTWAEKHSMFCIRGQLTAAILTRPAAARPAASHSARRRNLYANPLRPQQRPITPSGSAPTSASTPAHAMFTAGFKIPIESTLTCINIIAKHQRSRKWWSFLRERGHDIVNNYETYCTKGATISSIIRQLTARKRPRYRQ